MSIQKEQETISGEADVEMGASWRRVGLGAAGVGDARDKLLCEKGQRWGRRSVDWRIEEWKWKSKGKGEADHSCSRSRSHSHQRVSEVQRKSPRSDFPSGVARCGGRT